MGKRSKFERVERDFYPTPRKAVIPLVSHLPNDFTFAEPCVGKYDLVNHLQDLIPYSACGYASDIDQGDDALNLTEEDVKYCDYIITNPPWTRSILHPLIDRCRGLRPSRSNHVGGWAFTKQAIPYLKYCSDIVVVGRVKWIPDSKFAGKDDCAWYKFINKETETKFHNE